MGKERNPDNAHDAPLPAMLESILEAAAGMFPGEDWRSVEEHVRRAWNSVAHEHDWESVRDIAQRAWEGLAHPH